MWKALVMYWMNLRMEGVGASKIVTAGEIVSVVYFAAAAPVDAMEKLSW